MIVIVESPHFHRKGINQQAQPSLREHLLYVAIAKCLFHHPEHGIVSVRYLIKIKDAKRYGLSPLILSGLTVARLLIRWMTFTLVAEPSASREVLLKAWRNAEGLCDRPDTLQVNRYLATAGLELGGRIPCKSNLPLSTCFSRVGNVWTILNFAPPDGSPAFPPHPSITIQIQSMSNTLSGEEKIKRVTLRL